MADGILYGTPPSRASRITWLSSEIGIELEMKHVNILAGEHKGKDYSEINVLQQVPAFADGDVTIGESLAITLYLARKHKGDACPQTPAEEAQVYQWTMIAANVDGQTAPIMTHRIMLLKDKCDEKAVQAAMRGIKRTLAGVERHLSQGNQWLLGDRFTVADINLAGACSILHFTDLSNDVGPVFAAWLARALDRPAAKRDITPPTAPPPEIAERIMKMMADS